MAAELVEHALQAQHLEVEVHQWPGLQRVVLHVVAQRGVDELQRVGQGVGHVLEGLLLDPRGDLSPGGGKGSRCAQRRMLATQSRASTGSLS